MRRLGRFWLSLYVPIITRNSQRLTSTSIHSWVRASEEAAGVLARALCGWR
jgi:hypothetical protein